MICLAIAAAPGCGRLHKTSYERYFVPTSPSLPPPTAEVGVFDYEHDLPRLLRTLYANYEVIGFAQFSGPAESAEQAAPFARSIGADAVVHTRTFRRVGPAISRPITPDTQAPNWVGASVLREIQLTSPPAVAESAPPRGDNDDITRLFDHFAVFLRADHGGKPLWQQSHLDYPPNHNASIVRLQPRRDEGLTIELYPSGRRMVGVVAACSRDRRRAGWKTGQVVMVLNPLRQRGVVLTADRKPVPVSAIADRPRWLDLHAGRYGTFSFRKTDAGRLSFP
jgi:hypothetical protein